MSHTMLPPPEYLLDSHLPNYLFHVLIQNPMHQSSAFLLVLELMTPSKTDHAAQQVLLLSPTLNELNPQSYPTFLLGNPTQFSPTSTTWAFSPEFFPSSSLLRPSPQVS